MLQIMSEYMEGYSKTGADIEIQSDRAGGLPEQEIDSGFQPPTNDWTFSGSLVTVSTAAPSLSNVFSITR